MTKLNKFKIKMPENITDEFLELIKLPNVNGKTLNYLMVMPSFARWDDEAYRMPYGFCLVSSSLKASGRNVYTLNLNYKENPYDLLSEVILKNKIDVLITGGLSGQYALVNKILDTAKKTKPNIITCIGGGILTADPSATMGALEADYGMFGEGEITVNDLAFALENDEAPGAVAGVVTSNGEKGPYRSGIMNLDIIPFPDYEGYDMKGLLENTNYRSTRKTSVSAGAIPIATGRSCPYGCTFCFSTCDKVYRRRSFENVKKELDWLLKLYPKVEMIQFNDEMIGNDIEYIYKIADYMNDNKLKYQIFQRVDLITKDMLIKLRNTGCQHIFFGVESADEMILKSMKKGINVNQIENAFDLALEVGISVRGFIILGDTNETAETINTTLNWWKDHPQYDVTINWILTFPGTHIYHQACKDGKILDRVEYLKNGDMQINITKMSDKAYDRMVKIVTLFQILSTSGSTLDFDSLDNVTLSLKNTLDSVSLNDQIAIWPAKFETIAMLNEISPKFVSNENVHFVNIDPSSSYVSACERFGKKVLTPDEVFTKNEIDNVFCFHSNRARGAMVFNQIKQSLADKYPSVKKITNIMECI